MVFVWDAGTDSKSKDFSVRAVAPVSLLRPILRSTTRTAALTMPGAKTTKPKLPKKPKEPKKPQVDVISLKSGTVVSAREYRESALPLASHRSIATAS